MKNPLCALHTRFTFVDHDETCEEKRTNALAIGVLLIPLGLIFGSQLLLVNDQVPDVPKNPVVVSNTPSATPSAIPSPFA